MGRRGDFTRNGGIAKTCKILSNAGFVLGTPTLARAGETLHKLVLSNAGRNRATLARAGETLPDNPRDIAPVRRYAGLQRVLWSPDVWYSPYVTLQRVSVNRRSLDHPGVLVRGALQPGDALIQDGDLCHQCGERG